MVKTNTKKSNKLINEKPSKDTNSKKTNSTQMQKSNNKTFQFKVGISELARGILTDEEVPQLVKLMAPEFKKHKGQNAFGLTKLGIWIIRQKTNELIIITDDEKKKIEEANQN